MIDNSLGDRVFAVKTISKRKIKKELFLLERELAILRSLDHPNIVRVYEHYQDDRYFHIVMEYCSGGELFDRIFSKGYLDERECAIIMEKAFSAVKYLHENGIVHRDIKPENFLFADNFPDAELKLIDFGLARKYEPTQTLQTRAGTPLYIAPEVLHKNYDYRCDYWSLGVMMYVILSGCPPFPGESNEDLFINILKGRYDFDGPQWEKVSPKAKDLISKLMVVDPEKRISAREALKHPWIKEMKKSKVDYESTKTIINNLRQFTKVGRFKKEALNVIVSYLEEQEIKKLRDAFRYCDEDNTGMITITQLQKVMKDIGLTVSENEMSKIIEKIQIEPSDKINYTPFIAAAMNSKHYIDEEMLWLAFKHFDVDNSGFITFDDIKEFMQKTGKVISDEVIKQMIKDNDFTRDGKISFVDFCMVMKPEALENDEIEVDRAKTSTQVL